MVYKLYDSSGACFVTLESYEEYLAYFMNVLRPSGMGTRYVYGRLIRGSHDFEYGMLVINHA